MDAAQVTSIVAAVDFSTIIVGIAGIAAVIATVKVAKTGVRTLLGMMGRA
jgi:hypothetical protein